MPARHSWRMRWWKRAKVILEALLAVPVIAAALGFMRAWVSGDASVTPGFSFTPGFAMQLYAGIISGGIVLICGWNWPWITARRPSERFRKLEPDIRNAMEKSLLSITLSDEQDFQTPIATARTKAIILKISQSLDDLGINHPSPIGDGANLMWVRFLPYILAASEMGKIREARKIWRGLNEDRR